MLHTFITTRRASAGRQDDLLSVLLAVYRRRPAADPIGERGALDELHHEVHVAQRGALLHHVAVRTRPAPRICFSSRRFGHIFRSGDKGVSGMLNEFAHPPKAAFCDSSCKPMVLRQSMALRSQAR
jgi:hypothetical protein